MLGKLKPAVDRRMFVVCILVAILFVQLVWSQACSSFGSCSACNAGTLLFFVFLFFLLFFFFCLVFLSGAVFHFDRIVAAPGRCVWCVGGLLYEPECRDAHAIGNNAAGNTWTDYACNPGYLVNGPIWDRDCMLSCVRVSVTILTISRTHRPRRSHSVCAGSKGW